MKNQCHELSSTLFICLAPSGIHLTGGNLLDNHSAVSISLKNVKQTRDRRCIFVSVQRWLGSTGKTAKPSSTGCSVALLLTLYHPALQQTNGQSGQGEVTCYKYTDQEDSFQIEITGCMLSAKFSLSTNTQIFK